jgi:hypothetical protein
VIALRTTWRTIKDLEPYAIRQITPDRSLTVAVLNRRQAPPVDARRGATSDQSLDVKVNDNVSDDRNSLYFRDGTSPTISHDCGHPSTAKRRGSASEMGRK